MRFSTSVSALSVMLSTILAAAASGDVVYSISSATSTGSNGANGGTPTFTDNMDGTFTLAHANITGANNAVYLNSVDNFAAPTNDINALTAATLGRSLLSTDTVVVSGTVDSTTGFNLNANGIELGIVSEFFQVDADGTTPTGDGAFRSRPNLAFQVDDNGNLSGPAPFYNTDFTQTGGANVNRADYAGITEASLIDGFSYTATYTANSIVFELTNIVVDDTLNGATAGDTTYTAALTGADLVGYSLTDDVGAGFAYLSFQDQGGGGSYDISQFQIEVIAVPEPSSCLLIGLVSTGLLVRRRRR